MNEVPGNCPCCGQSVADMRILKKRDYVKILKILNSIEYDPQPGDKNYQVLQRFRNILAKRITGWKGLYNEKPAGNP